MLNENDTHEQSEKTSLGKKLLGIFVILIAVGGALLMLASRYDWPVPYIEGFGGNQNPLVGIPNSMIFLGEMSARVFLARVGAILLAGSVIAFVVGFLIWRTSSRPWRTVARLSASVFVVTAVVAFSSTISDNRLERQKTHAENVLRGNNMNIWRQLHAPGPFVDYYDNGQKAVEGQYDVNQKMSGLWTGWRETGEVRWEGTFVDGLSDGMFKYWTAGHVRPSEREFGAGHSLHGLWYYADGQIKGESISTRVERDSNSSFGYGDYVWHQSITGWYPSQKVKYQSNSIHGTLQNQITWFENGQKESEKVLSETQNYWIERRWTSRGDAVPCIEGELVSNQTYCAN